ncbi:hypothetical protein CC86DRAFT_213972 [Ophiobolus disseminans]|uniref:Uncharacterized protein n=1 Tax=Ophiobolus disseminans TaxID=1469910 RepID=A0A6A7A4B0_9PLEO|nr:hypothetical protein CC86DRAFT_213972 [Ophiobolus disseminans]
MRMSPWSLWAAETNAGYWKLENRLALATTTRPLRTGALHLSTFSAIHGRTPTTLFASHKTSRSELSGDVVCAVLIKGARYDHHPKTTEASTHGSSEQHRASRDLVRLFKMGMHSPRLAPRPGRSFLEKHFTKQAMTHLGASCRHHLHTYTST